MRVPVIIRMEGTNLKEGRKILAESGLDLINAKDLNAAEMPPRNSRPPSSNPHHQQRGLNREHICQQRDQTCWCRALLEKKASSMPVHALNTAPRLSPA
jgi:hypothetical protein